MPLAVNAPNELGIFRRSSRYSRNLFFRQQGFQRGCRGCQCGQGLARNTQHDEEGLQIIIDNFRCRPIEKIFVESTEIFMNAGIFPVSALNERGIADDIYAGIEHIGRL